MGAGGSPEKALNHSQASICHLNCILLLFSFTHSRADTSVITTHWDLLKYHCLHYIPT